MAGNDPNAPLPADIGTELDALEGAVSGKIQNSVIPLLPKELAQNKLSDVKVVFFETLKPKEVAEPSMAMQALGWASQNFNTLTMAGVALVSLLLLRSIVKSIPHV